MVNQFICWRPHGVRCGDTHRLVWICLHLQREKIVFPHRFSDFPTCRHFRVSHIEVVRSTVRSNNYNRGGTTNKNIVFRQFMMPSHLVRLPKFTWGKNIVLLGNSNAQTVFQTDGGPPWILERLRLQTIAGGFASPLWVDSWGSSTYETAVTAVVHRFAVLPCCCIGNVQ